MACREMKQACKLCGAIQGLFADDKLGPTYTYYVGCVTEECNNHWSYNPIDAEMVDDDPFWYGQGKFDWFVKRYARFQNG